MIEFEDYTTDELMQIASKMYEDQGYSLFEDAPESRPFRKNLRRTVHPERFLRLMRTGGQSA